MDNFTWIATKCWSNSSIAPAFIEVKGNLSTHTHHARNDAFGPCTDRCQRLPVTSSPHADGRQRQPGALSLAQAHCEECKLDSAPGLSNRTREVCHLLVGDTVQAGRERKHKSPLESTAHGSQVGCNPVVSVFRSADLSGSSVISEQD